MTEEIRVQKNTVLIVVGLLLAIVFGGYLVFGTTSNSQATGVTTLGQTTKTIGNQPNQAVPSAGQPSAPNKGMQEVYLKATGYGYDKSEITVKKDIPVRLHFTAENAGCGRQLVIYGLDVRALSQNGEEAIVEFTPTKEGSYQYSCGMRMFPPGNFIVTA